MKAMLFADGENLLFRYEAMLAKGATVRSEDVRHSKGRFLWSDSIMYEASRFSLRATRVEYHTTLAGNDETIQKLRSDLRNIAWVTKAEHPPPHGRIHGRVFKKPAQSQKIASVDMNITIDVLRNCHHKDIEAVYILTGDGDYIPLIEEAMRTGTRVFVGALSEGLNQKLRVVPDEFIDLDGMFFPQ